MKRTFTALLTVAMLAAAGCAADEPTPTPAPQATAAPVAESTPQNSPMVQVTPEATDNMAGSIENFVEGGVVEAEKLPTAIKDAIKGKYPVSTIKDATYATYDGQQTYKIVVESTEDQTGEEVYVTADGKIIPLEEMTGSETTESKDSENKTSSSSK